MWGGNVDYYMRQLEQNLSKTMTAETSFALISQTLGTNLPDPPQSDQGTPDKKKPIRFNDADVESLLGLEITHTHSLDYSIEIPMATLVDKLAKTTTQKIKMQKALEQVDVASLKDPKKISWTYLVANAVGSKPIADACVERAKALEISSDQPLDDKNLPSELALVLIATRMSKEGAENEIATRILERSEAFAKTIKQPDLARTLRIKIAERIAKSEPAKSKAIFQEVLDELMPAKKMNKE
jgi:hypothetical protein